MTTNASTSTAPRWRVGRVLLGVGLGLIAHVAATAITYYFARTGKGLEGIIGLERAMCLEVVNAIIMIAYGISLLRQRKRDLATGMLAAWLLPLVLLGILAGIYELRG